MLYVRLACLGAKNTPACRRLQAVAAQTTEPTNNGGKLQQDTPDKSEALSNPALQKLIKSHFPRSRFCFAYGSKILHQTDNLPTSSTMTDIIFVTDNSLKWHQDNFERNKHHYSLAMRTLGPTAVAVLQDSFKAHCYFNPYVKVDGVLLKYGIISEANFVRDLQNWDTLYVAGRLHKPVLVLHKDPGFDTHLKHNLRSALHTALILLPECFSDHQLFSIISRLSYYGDFRGYIAAEHPDKIRNIVEPNIPHFREHYSETIDSSPFIQRTDYGYCQTPNTPNNLLAMEGHIPGKVLYIPPGINPSSRAFTFDKKNPPKEQLFRKIAAGDNRYPNEALRKIVFMPSVYQAVKGFITAGPWKSGRYSLSKLMKGKATRVQSKQNTDLPAEVQQEERLMSQGYTHNTNKHPLRLSWKKKEDRIPIVVLVFTMILFNLYVYQKTEGKGFV